MLSIQECNRSAKAENSANATPALDRTAPSRECPQPSIVSTFKSARSNQYVPTSLGWKFGQFLGRLTPTESHLGQISLIADRV